MLRTVRPLFFAFLVLALTVLACGPVQGIIEPEPKTQPQILVGLTSEGGTEYFAPSEVPLLGESAIADEFPVFGGAERGDTTLYSGIDLTVENDAWLYRSGFLVEHSLWMRSENGWIALYSIEYQPSKGQLYLFRKDQDYWLLVGASNCEASASLNVNCNVTIVLDDNVGYRFSYLWFSESGNEDFFVELYTKQ